MILDPGSPLYVSLAALVDDHRLVFFAGLPGTGKSLLIHEAGHRYPQIDGVTHGMIRVAAGRWARRAIGRWDREHPGDEPFLIGETPFVGHRFVELARPADDAAEPILAARSTCFVIPVPSRTVRRHLEAERDRRAQRPLHEREREDAPPQVMRDLWRQITVVGRELGVSHPAPETDAEYDPQLYRRVYLHILARRRAQVLAMDEVLLTASFSAHAFDVPCGDVLPSDDDVRRCIREAEEAYADPQELHREIERWYVSR